MPVQPTGNDRPTILIAGASRGLGLALAEEFAHRDWRVMGTVRAACTPVHDLASRSGNAIEVETLDIDRDEQVAALRRRLDGAY